MKYVWIAKILRLQILHYLQKNNQALELLLSSYGDVN